MEVTLSPIGIVHSCFKEKFGVPRQPGLVSEARAVIELLPPFNRAEFVRGLDGFSHLWVLFLFHHSMKDGWNPTVRPPRLGGKKRVGVFASRSPFRPNPIGMSAVKLDEINSEKGNMNLHVSGVDLIDGTPVMDIKPYVSYSDSIADAISGYAVQAPEKHLDVIFSDEALQRLEEESKKYEGLERLIIKMLDTDPRPAYYKPRHSDSEFAFKLLDLEIKWKVVEDKVVVSEIAMAETGK
ncbi:MAG: tRNA (N6-threonylcarbamoyladenosine(37)-N6)-methyltransferase TrmO [Proteobacteria bacterium]|nr:tRNA (N6-threonylcarbamoyladenosine(37)-N6)-methyltransferase TrmO [Pseudomonadota bacterium]